MLHVVLDTSIYTGNPRRSSPPFWALMRLAKASAVKLYISEITTREFASQQREKVETPLKEVVASLKRLRKANAVDKFNTFANSTIAAAEAMSSNAAPESAKEFAKWLKDLKVSEIAMTLEDAQGAFEAYFAGEPPFKSTKNREDIPDAFIWQAVQRLAKTQERLYFVVNDGALRETAKQCKNIATYAKLDEFIQAKECQDALKAISADENRDKNRERIEDRFPHILPGLTKIVESEMLNALDGKEVRDSKIPDDNNEGLIIGVGDVSNVEFSLEKTEYYGEDDIGIFFRATVDCTLNYAIYKADYYLLDEEETEGMSIDERNKHYFDVDEDYSLEVSGTLTLKIDGEMLEDELEDEELDEIILNSDTDVEVDEIAVA